MSFCCNWTSTIKLVGLLLLCLLLLMACSSADKHASLCETHFLAKSYKVALKHCEQAVEDGDIPAHYYLGMIYIRSDQPEQGYSLVHKAAEEGFDKAIFYQTVNDILDPENSEVAESALKKMQSFAESGDDVAQFWMGNIFLFGHAGQQKSPNEASYWYQLSVKQHNYRAMNNLAWIKALARGSELYDPEGAIRLAQRVVNKYPEAHGYLDTLAAAYAADGQFDKAVIFQTKAVDLVSAGKCQNCSEKLLGYYQSHLQQYQQEKPLEEDLLK
ncbi:tetratricopeptide repeat protein [Kangiella shandongensis]|uniref:tetratricopeptide repeat protein n=1 Tax=Kangiella shandongensis TaxID=2763258 RepID=UPI001CBE931F|nr:sel1 repeat family protein [Kangiella shandongensis]